MHYLGFYIGLNILSETEHDKHWKEAKIKIIILIVGKTGTVC